MADDVPVTDILCEAMEYLSKLGTNLRSRSENLKEKRIRKDRLKNSHAVLKAAQKVLTICELSKKSLENVELGVKRILSVVDAAQASTGDGGKTERSDNITSRLFHSSAHKPSSENRMKHKDLSSPKSIYVSGKKYKLRFPINVNVKHFQSVKVLARSMPRSLWEKYPVYYNCKLYRARERKERNLSSGSKTSVGDNASKEKNECDSKETEKQDSQNSEVEECNNEIHNRNDSHDDKSLPEIEDVKKENKSETESKNKHERKQSKESCDLYSAKKHHKNKTTEKLIQKHSGLKKNTDDSEEEAYYKQKKDKSKKTKHKRIIVDSSSSESDQGKNKISPVKATKKEYNKVDLQGEEKELNNTTSVENLSTISGEKPDEILNQPGESSLEKSDNESTEKKTKDSTIKKPNEQFSEEKPSEDISDDEKPSEVISDDEKSEESSKEKPNNEPINKTVAEKEDLNSEQHKNVNEDNQETESIKPMIKCVSLNKLLKPDVLVKEAKSQVIVHMNRKGELKSKLMDPVKLKSENSKLTDSGNVKSGHLKAGFKKTINISSEDEEELAEKRKQVAAFKAKTFDIIVIKLPKLCIEFLHENNLKKITQSGTIISEIVTETTNCKLNSDSGSASSMDDKSTNEAKNALLNDSDGEKSEPSPRRKKTKITTFDDINETEKIKNSLLNDSDSDKNEEEPNKETSESVSKTLEDKSSKSVQAETDSNKDQLESHINLGEEREKSPDKEKANDDQDKELAKSSLLNDSSGSSSKSPEKRRKKDDSGIKSRRKHIMESMHAKKMLLTYSSSSDTEDEQLKNVIKDMKDNLIKDIENEGEAKKCLTKNVFSSSESDEEVLKHVKKKRKISKSRSDIQTKAVNDDKDGKAENKEDNSANCDHSDSASEKSNSSRSKMGRTREKAGGSSSQNSDTLDDKDIEGLTNLKSLSKHRRRHDSDSDKAESTTSARGSAASVKKEKMFNLKHIAGEEGLLEAPNSSGEASAAESEGAEEDLPPISLAGLNGDSLEHLAKDDLLEESESNSSKDIGSDGKKVTDSDSDALKSKRRKGNTISSDSEAGSSSRKEKEVRNSDFEDSEDENSEPIKRSKRKKKGSESDASNDSSTDGGKKKRRRIKQLDSDASGSDSDLEGKNKHGRKNIRKVMGKNQLEEATKKAAREEKERVARIVERQKMYNNLEFDESGKPDEVIVDKVVLDFDPTTKEPLIEVDRGLVKKLKPHQANGIKFMWDACFESVKRIKKDRGSGCILAHCMGLGKTLQVVSLTHTLLTHSDLTKVNRVLVVCPLSTVLNWVNEFKMWLKHAERDYEVDVYELSKFKQNSERAFQLSSWFTHGGVCVLGYEMFRNLSADNPKKFKKKMLRQFQESLVDPGPDMVVCDEGHLLKNEKTSLSQSMNRVKTRRRIVLTGTPLQNNLKEYYCMVQFVKPNLLGKYNEYLNRFVNPITNGQYTDSTEYDIKVMKRRSHVLHKMLDGAVQRRDYGVLAPFLPPKHEYVLFITLTEVQVKLYQHYLDNYSRRPLAGKSSGFLFPDFQSMQRIWTHPLVLKYNSERYEIMQQKKRDREEEEDSEGSLVDFIDDDSTPDETSSDDDLDSLSDGSDDSRKKSKKKKSAKKSKKEGKAGQRRGTRANPVELEDVEQDPEVLEVKNENPTEWWIPLVTDDEVEDMRNSHKLMLLFEILRQCEAIGDKLLVFSQSLYSLDLIEHFLGKVDEATQEGRIDEKLGGHVGSWSPGVDYFRLDGSTSCENRSIWCKNFNREDNPRARLFLISTRAGGLGINLVAANRVVIFDVSWNPSHDVQSIFRVYRFGQKKPCYIYRFLAMGTMEEKIYERQVTKQAISKRVIDEQQIDRHYAENDLAELYKFEPRPPEPRPVPPLPKDRLFAEMLKEREAVIYKFHEHDSLLENKEEETLSEEERKAAWEDFENEKNRPPPQPFPSWPMHNGMGQLPNLLAQQQQQLAYAALAQMLRKDMPNLSDDNIRAMLPLIYSSNPQMFGGYDYGLMQKLSNMYAQPGMMNPAMMNPGMNVGGPQGGMGGGGTSGLQYEPPWQRQQQQQQQMRLQQLMQQQQNQMGAKLYAGGLGSRDPIAMALQQQRAREIMLGGGGGGGAAAGRPRGRPPLQPRAPSTAPGDVVNLDSD